MSEPERPNAVAPARTRGRSPYLLWLIWMVWLPFLFSAIAQFLQSQPAWPRLLGGLAGATLFAGLYAWATLRNAQRLLATVAPVERRPLLAAWLPVIALATLSTTMVVIEGPVWGSLFIFTAAYAAGRLPVMQAAGTLLGLCAIIALGVLRGHLDGSNAASGIALVTIVGVVVILLVRSVATERELRVAREEIARLAVMTERLRIARDLHDLLGHNLSLIALKSELARKLLNVAPERAAGEIGDVENVARSTLEEVREAVSNYRQPTLANELHAASEILSAAGIAYRYQGTEIAPEALPTQLEALLSWTVREGVTNVIRHSHARQCTIHVTRDQHNAGVEVLDDGPVRTPQPDTTSAPGKGGNGLRGLKERVAALGGECETGPRATGGFRLAVSVPLALHKHAGAAS